MRKLVRPDFRWRNLLLAMSPGLIVLLGALLYRIFAHISDSTW